MSAESTILDCDINILRQKLSTYGVGRRNVDDVFFKDCPVTKVYNEPISLADLYPEDYESYNVIEDEVPCQVPGCDVMSKSLGDYEAHYNLAHRHTCSQCKRRLPTAHLLDLHLSEVHDSFFAVLSLKKPSFACYIQECQVKSQTPQERHKHCIEDHKFPADFKYEVQDYKKKKNNKGKKKKSQFNLLDDNLSEPMEVACPEYEKNKITYFNFGHSQTKSFGHVLSSGKYKKDKMRKDKPQAVSKLDSDDVMSDIKESLCNLEDVKT